MNGPLFRIHSVRHGALFFGQTGDNRFDDPRREFGVLYGGLSEACAFSETFAEPLDVPFVTEAQLRLRRLTRIDLRPPVRLVDLRGPHLRRIGADARLFAADHASAQRWSRAFFEHPDQPDGIVYRARHDPAQHSVAIFDRARAALHAHATRTTLASKVNQPLVAQLLAKYGLGLI